MNHCVPNFELEEEELNLDPTPPGLLRQKKSKIPEEDELVELVWQNGQVVMQSQSQTQRSPKKSSQRDAILDIRSCTAAAEEDESRHLFMQEDEMVSWMQYPYPLDDSFDRDFCADLLYTSPTRNLSHLNRVTQIPEENETPASPAPAAAPPQVAPRPPPISLAKQEENSSRSKSRPPVLDKVARELTVIDSNETPAVGPASRVSNGGRSWAPVSGGRIAGDVETMDVVRELNCETTVTSSSAVSGGSADQSVRPPTTDRKRKGREEADSECHSEDDEESVDEKKQARGSTSARRARAAEVHNLSERRRRDRINEKMKALQELIPRCNKSDKASMLDEAIEYLKSLQLQVQGQGKFEDVRLQVVRSRSQL